MIVVYSQPQCVQCTATIQHLTSRGIDHEIREASKHVDELKQLGHHQAPVVVLDSGESFSGFRPERLSA